MNTLQAYQLIIKHVTETNNLAARLRDGKVTKKDAVAEYKKILEDSLKELD